MLQVHKSFSISRLVGVPISACPSDDEAAADKELEDMIMTRCYGPAGKDTGELEATCR